MKILSHKFKTFLYIAIMSLIAVAPAHADTVTQIGTMEGGVYDIFTLEFYTDANVLYSTSLPFTNIDPARSLCYPDGRAEYDGKSDIGLICSTNMNTQWYLKMGATSIGAVQFPMENFKYYMSMPWDRNLGQPSSGTLAHSPAWYSISTSPDILYTSGANDLNNLPFGTLATMSFAISPSGLPAGARYTIRIDFTFTTAP